MKINRVILLSSLIVLPLAPTSWYSIKYDNIKSNQVIFENNKTNNIKIVVDNSASPLVSKLNSPSKIKGFKLTLNLKGNLNIDEHVKKINDSEDFVFRFGLVVVGNKHLNFFQKLVSPEWVKSLYRLGGDQYGIEKIEFYNLSTKDLGWEYRIHPSSELISEKIIGCIHPGLNDISYNLESEKEIIGIWISADGDDTKSSFEIVVNDIELR